MPHAQLSDSFSIESPKKLSAHSAQQGCGLIAPTTWGISKLKDKPARPTVCSSSTSVLVGFPKSTHANEYFPLLTTLLVLHMSETSLGKVSHCGFQSPMLLNTCCSARRKRSPFRVRMEDLFPRRLLPVRNCVNKVAFFLVVEAKAYGPGISPPIPLNILRAEITKHVGPMWAD
jgi:hypothetical protein